MGVTIFGILNIGSSLFAIIYLGINFFPYNSLPTGIKGQLLLLIAFLTFLLIVALFISGIELLRLKKLGRGIILGLGIANIVTFCLHPVFKRGTLSSFEILLEIPRLAYSLVVLYYFNRKDIKALFLKRKIETY